MVKKNMLSRLTKYPTPLYFYDLQLLDQTLKDAVDAAQPYSYHIHFAVKANNNDRILESIQRHGMGADCVSGNEIREALKRGFPANKIVFAGVGKTDNEIKLGLETDIFAFNCESLQEINVINDLAGSMGKKARIFLRLNPDVEAHTHKNITTGKAENKFGINATDTDIFLTLKKDFKNVEFVGLHFHIGSQICDFEVFKNLSLKVNEIQDLFESKGEKIKYLNLGGGLGINYADPQQNPIPDFAGYFETFHKYLKLRPGQEVHFELGRALVAQCGTLLSRVLYIKPGVRNQFAIIDASMTDLLRPALYEAQHRIENLSSEAAEKKTYDVAGPVCESSDVFARNILLEETRRGDFLAIYSTGAYGQVMSSLYNMRDPATTIYSDEVE
ncbi:MAG: diaminopimelate decarboxylase [Bacteroidales bacterium]|nr:diaminopimelate decarboxylase [Bacteroidales bacterium]